MRLFGIRPTSHARCSQNIIGSWRVRLVLITLSLVSMTSGPLVAQELTVADYQMLRINEILAVNDTTFPQDCRCRFRDMIEIYNGSDKALPLDGELGLVRLWDRSFQYVTLPDCYAPTAYSFRGQAGDVISPGERLIVYCGVPQDCTDRSETCELDLSGIASSRQHYAPFRLGGNGECLVLTLDPDKDQATNDEVLLHEVNFPPLRPDISWARFPEDPSNLDGFHYARASFQSPGGSGGCYSTPPGHPDGPICIGEENEASDMVQLPPDVERIDYSTSGPAADEAVWFRVRIETDDEYSR